MEGRPGEEKKERREVGGGGGGVTYDFKGEVLRG